MALNATNAPLMYAPPPMVDPTIIDLSTTGSQNYWSFSNSQDVIFVNSAGTTLSTSKVQVQGGHNIEMLGLDIATQPGATGAIALYGLTGTAFVDGVHIDNAKASGTDGIDIAGGNNGAGVSLVVQNTNIDNVNGAKDGGQASDSNGHADGIQMQGSVGGEIDLYNVDVSTNYQGIFISPQYSTEPSAAHLTNVSLSYTGPADNKGNVHSYLLWTLDGGGEKAYPFTFDSVYVQPRDGQQAVEDAVWPKAEGGAVQNGDQISWPSLPYTGAVTVGSHADFADASKIGVHFTDAQALIAASTGAASVATAGAAPTAAPAAASANIDGLLSHILQGGAPAAQPAPAQPDATQLIHQIIDHWN